MMLKSKHCLGDLELVEELVEELEDKVSEKISGGATVDALLEELSSLTILDQDLKTEIDIKIQELFPQGLGNASSLSCVTTDDGNFDCKVSSNGETKGFKIPLQ